jgi:hypothetical protein
LPRITRIFFMPLFVPWSWNDTRRRMRSDFAQDEQYFFYCRSAGAARRASGRKEVFVF